MATHSSILAWRIPGTGEPGGLLSMGSHRVGHDWSDLACMHALAMEMATHSSILAWRNPGTEEPGGLPSMGSHRVGHDWSGLAAAAAQSFEEFVLIPWVWAACMSEGLWEQQEERRVFTFLKVWRSKGGNKDTGAVWKQTCVETNNMRLSTLGSQGCHLKLGWPWTSYLTSLYLLCLSVKQAVVRFKRANCCDRFQQCLVYNQHTVLVPHCFIFWGVCKP